MDSLWGEEFKLPEKPKVKKIIDKIQKESKKQSENKTTEKVVKSKKVSFFDKVKAIKDKVYQVLGNQIDNVKVIYDKNELHQYLLMGLSSGRISIDTETNNSLDPITCKLMGLCLYVKGQKQVYVPVNHVDPVTLTRLDNQLTENDIHDELNFLINNKGDCKFIFHNGKFDYQVIKMTCGVKLPIDWDTMLGAKLLNENEQAGLKWQYIDKCDKNQEKYSIENLFEGLQYELFEPDLFALYSATDALMTDKLYEYQKDQFKNPDLNRVYKVLTEVEVPLIEVVAEMELRGVYFDQEYSKRLSAKYNKKLEELDKEMAIELSKFKSKIDAWRLTPEANEKQKSARSDNLGKSKSEQLEDPINLGSPSQLAILLYDVLKVKPVDKKKPRGTGEDILSKIDLPFCKLMLKRRELVKLIDSFIDSLPKTMNIDGRVHCNFNQFGTVTGRFSSSEPNLQQIPSHNKEIRMLFRAQPGYILVGSDYSQQEPRTLSQFSQDENMINAYKNGKDLYATIASGVYHNRYEDNLEFNKDGTPNPEGAKRRSSVKSLLLGIMYGRGVASIAEQIGGTTEEAQAIIDGFYNAYPKVKLWMDKTLEDARKTGYVEDYWGKRRRLDDILLPRYEFIDNNIKKESNFNPFLICEDRVVKSNLISKYQKKLESVKNRKQYESIKEDALKEGLEIHDNGGFISQAERQCVNARIQGSAATMTKLAMLKLYHDKELKDLGFSLLIGVHDELIGECPEDNVDKVAELLTKDMMTVLDGVFDVPFKCDADISYNWYFNNLCAEVKKQYNDLIKKGLSEKDAFTKVSSEHSEFLLDNIIEVIFRDFQKDKSESDWINRYNQVINS